MITYLKKLFISVLLCITTSIVHAEYIVYKDGQDAAGATVMLPLDEREHAQAYAVLMKYQFPMSLCHDLEKELSKEELAALDEDEEAFIQSKMPTGIKVAFIPTVVYELFIFMSRLEAIANYAPHGSSQDNTKIAIQNLVKGPVDLDNVYSNLSSELGTKNKINHSEWNEPDYLKTMLELHAHKRAVNMHYTVNNSLSDWLNKSRCKINETQLILGMLKSIQELWTSKNKLIHTNYSLSFPERHISYCSFALKVLSDAITSVEYSNQHARLIVQIAKLETRAQAAGQFLLLRGTNPLMTCTDSTIRPPHLHSVSYSAGLSLLAAFCPTLYCLFMNYYCNYALTIKREEYRKKERVSNLFFIPPLPTLWRFSLGHDDAHPRTKVVRSSNKIIHPNGFNNSNIVICKDFIYTSAFSSQDELEKAFQDYLSKNLIWIKKPEYPTIRAKL